MSDTVYIYIHTRKSTHLDLNLTQMVMFQSPFITHPQLPSSPSNCRDFKFVGVCFRPGPSPIILAPGFMAIFLPAKLSRWSELPGNRGYLRKSVDILWRFTDMLWIFTDILWIFTDILWIFTDILWIFTDMLWRFTDILWRFTDIHWYSLIFTDIHWYSLIFTDIHYRDILFKWKKMSKREETQACLIRANVWSWPWKMGMGRNREPQKVGPNQ